MPSIRQRPINAITTRQRSEVSMRFGSFVFPVSHHPENDAAVIDSTLDEIVLAEQIGMHSVWLTEHHFDGAAAHADPLVLGAAIAARTRTLKIGFAVVELAFHHPVRLAIQTALLDNLSHGRLIVGTGRGSAYNHYEYLGFGLTMADGIARLDEAERLLVAAWTGQNLHHDGPVWDVRFPRLRPRPYQQPHPPLIRACISAESVVNMARIGRPVMIGIQTLPTLQSRLESYRAAMLDAGFNETETESAYDQCWASRDLFIADSYDAAYEMAAAGFERERTHFRQAREQYNPGGFPPPDPNRPIPAGEVLEHAFIMGTPAQAAEQVAAMRDIGVRNLMLKLNVGEMDTQQVQRSMRLFGEKVMPHFV